MIIQKVSILLIAFTVSFLQPSVVNSNDPAPSSQKEFINPDSIVTQVNRNGWTVQSLSGLRDYFINSEADVETDLKIINKLRQGYRRALLRSILLKKQNKFTAMFDTLSSYLKSAPHFLPYYDELVFASKASGRLPLLESRVETSEKLYPRSKNYLLGLINYQKADYKTAKDYFEKSLQNDTTSKYILYQLSYAYRSLGNYPKALTLIKKAGDVSDNDMNFLVKSLLAEGGLYFLSAEYDLANETYERAFQLSVDNNLREVEGLSYVALGIMDDVQGFIAKAREKYNRAVKIAGSINNIEMKAYALSELGVSFSYSNELIEAKESYLQSYSLYNQLGNSLRLSLLSDNIGKIYMQIFNYESAIKYYLEGIEFAGDNKRSLVLNYTGLGDAYTNLANYAKALEYYSKAGKLSAEINAVELSVNINSGLGALNFNLDRSVNALGYYQQAEAECLQLNNPYLTADIYDKLGTVYSEMDSLDLSENYFSSAQKLAGENLDLYTAVLSGINLAEVLAKKQDYIKALVVLNISEKSASAEGFPYLQARVELLRGNILEKKADFSGAKSSYQNALEIVNNLNEKTLEVEAFFTLAKLLDSKNLYEASESYYSSAVKIIEDVSRPLFSKEDVQISYFSGNREVYDSFAEHYLKQKKYRSAFELVNKSHSRNMIQNLNNLKLQTLIKDSTTLSKLYDYDWIINSGVYSKERKGPIEKEMKKLKTTLVKKNPDLAQYLNMEKQPSLEDIQKSLEEGENLLSYYSTTNYLYAFLISQNKFTPFKLNISRKQLIESINNISPYFENNYLKTDAFYNQDLFSFNAKASNNLYNKIVSPVVQDIVEGQKIIISPCTELLSLPFEFLVTSFNDSESPYSYKNKTYLLTDYDISYAPSATVFIQQQKNELKNNGKVLLVGNPSINTETTEFAERRGLLDESPGVPRNLAFLPLRYSVEEVNNIGEIINATTILLDKNATETNFKENARLSRIIHLSTHSFLYKRQPLIFFSNTYDAENDGFLEASEIVQLKLNSDLVVLSSCNSGLGSVDESEGILGLTKAFFEAGSKSVVVSLWDVNDKYTSKLMALFYEKLSMGYDKSKALRLAKTEFIQKYSPNPYYWGAFILSGNISPVQLKPSENITLSIIILLMIITAAAVVVLILKRRRYNL